MPTSLSWGIYIDPINRPVAYANSEFFHPTFFYEFVANIILFGLLLLIHRLYRKRPDSFPAGLVFSTYLGIYAVYRSVIEYYRIDSSFFMGIKVVYILDAVTVIAVLIMINSLVKRFRAEKLQKKYDEDGD
jgi:phosphatidylglycerol:prolipoprotein diacylglycerol transferase